LRVPEASTKARKEIAYTVHANLKTRGLREHLDIGFHDARGLPLVGNATSRSLTRLIQRSQSVGMKRRGTRLVNSPAQRSHRCPGQRDQKDIASRQSGIPQVLDALLKAVCLSRPRPGNDYRFRVRRPSNQLIDTRHTIIV
jgi:hypothetical protein